MSDVVVSVLPLAGSKIRPKDFPVDIQNWKLAEDPTGDVIARISFKTGNHVIPGDGLVMTSGQAYMMYRSLAEYFKMNGGGTDGDRTGVVCVADRPSG